MTKRTCKFEAQVLVFVLKYAFARPNFTSQKSY